MRIAGASAIAAIAAAGRPRAEGADRFTDHVIQGKTILRALDDNHAGVGLAVGTVRHPRRTVATWGWGHEIRVRPDVYLIPEVLRSEPGRPFHQLGVRYWILKDVLQVDATYGNRFVSDTDARWFSIGLRVLTPPFLR